MHLISLLFLMLSIASCKDSFNPADYIIVSDCKILEATNGDILAKYPGGICEYDLIGHTYSYSRNELSKIAIKDHSVIWSTVADVHHDLGYDTKKNIIYALEREQFSLNGINFLGLKIVGRNADDGKVLFEWKSSRYQAMLDIFFTISADAHTPLLPPSPGLPKYPIDTKLYLDANQIDVLNWGHPLLKDKRFNRGDLLISFMNHSILAVLKLETLEIFKVAKVPISKGQIHSAHFTDNNTLSVFINQVAGHHNRSLAIELKLPDLDEVIWRYPQELTPAFYSPFFSSLHKLSDELYFVVDNTKGKIGYYFIDHKGKVLHKILAKGNSETLLNIYRAQAFSKNKLSQFISL